MPYKNPPPSKKVRSENIDKWDYAGVQHPNEASQKFSTKWCGPQFHGLKPVNPIDFFELFLDEELISYWAGCSNMYGHHLLMRKQFPQKLYLGFVFVLFIYYLLIIIICFFYLFDYF